MKNILVIKAHPAGGGLCQALADSYIDGAKSGGHQIEVLDLSQFSPLQSFSEGDNQTQSELESARALIARSDHLVFAYPTWWMSQPAILKLFFELVLTPGFAFKYDSAKSGRKKLQRLLSPKSARVIVTMDDSVWFYRFVLGDPGFKTIKAVLNFCGIRPVRRSYFCSVKRSTQAARESWLRQVNSLGKAGR